MIILEQKDLEKDTSRNYIKIQKTVMVDINKLEPHPFNRPLGKNQEKILQLKKSIQQHGFYGSQPLVIRSIGDKYQIIHGEHRYSAAKELDFKELPCIIEEMDDEEALIQLIIGNIQTENKPLEIGLNALEVTKKGSKAGYSISEYAKKIGLNRRTVSEYVQSAEVYKFVMDKLAPGRQLLEEVKKLLEISRCSQSDWLWLHDMIIEKDLSKTQVELVCKKAKEIDNITDIQELIDLFKVEQTKKKATSEALEGRNRAISNMKPALKAANEFYQNLESEAVFYSYDIYKNEIVKESVDIHELFLQELKNQSTLSKSTVNQAIDEVLQKKQQNSKEAAEQAANYYRKEKHNKELQERRRIEKERGKEVFKLWLSGISIKDIADNLSISTTAVEEYLENEKQEKLYEGLATFSDAGKKGGFKIPIYNIWKQQKKSDTPDYFGNSEIRWVENLLYLYTKPFDMVVDLFGGSGSTIDICQKRSRRYWVGDRLPIPERENEIHKWDITEGLPPSVNWDDARLVYLDPPYWKQAEGRYSKDATDLANMELDLFNSTLSGLINDIGKNLSDGYIALVIQPTQWNAPNRQFTDHIADMIKLVDLPIHMRYSVPYDSQQYNTQIVEWSKLNTKPFVLTREIIVWEKGG